MWKWYAQKIIGNKCERTIRVMIQWKLCFEHKTRMNGDHIIKILKLYRIVFSSHKLWFFMDHFCHEFFMFNIFFSFIVVCTQLRCYITSDVHFIMEALYEKKRFSESKKKDVLFSSMFFPMYLSFWPNFFFDSLIKIDASHHY